MLLGAAWILATAFWRLSHPPAQPALGVATAAVVAFVNVAINAVVLRSVWLAGRSGTSIILSGQIRSRVAQLAASALAACAIAANAVWGPEGLGRLADTAGSLLVIVTMAVLGFGMWRDALPHLFDRTLDESRQVAINRALVRRFADYDALGTVRSRLVGREAFIEITLGFRAQRTIGEIQHVTDAVADDIRELIPGAAVVVTPVALDRSDRSAA